jgi:nuclear transcription factor Y gamma
LALRPAQITALSQIQAQAIVHARKSQGTPQQIQTQIQLQAQALVHAHTQAQIAAGIYRGEEVPAAPARPTHTPAPVTTAAAAGAVRPANASSAASSTTTAIEPARVPNPVIMSSNTVAPMEGSAAGAAVSSTSLVPQAPAPSSSSPLFLATLNTSLTQFWKDQLQSVQELTEQTEQDFKTHNDLPLARIKRIMKSDEDVRMISAEAPVLFAKACELFILDLSIRSWNYSQLHKRRTLQKEDIREAIQKTDVLDFLVDVV